LSAEAGSARITRPASACPALTRRRTSSAVGASSARTSGEPTSAAASRPESGVRAVSATASFSWMSSPVVPANTEEKIRNTSGGSRKVISKAPRSRQRSSAITRTMAAIFQAGCITPPASDRPPG
jgi:hypothetical protein